MNLHSAQFKLGRKREKAMAVQQKRKYCNIITRGSEKVTLGSLKSVTEHIEIPVPRTV